MRFAWLTNRNENFFFCCILLLLSCYCCRCCLFHILKSFIHALAGKFCSVHGKKKKKKKQRTRGKKTEESQQCGAIQAFIDYGHMVVVNEVNRLFALWFVFFFYRVGSTFLFRFCMAICCMTFRHFDLQLVILSSVMCAIVWAVISDIIIIMSCSSIAVEVEMTIILCGHMKRKQRKNDGNCNNFHFELNQLLSPVHSNKLHKNFAWIQNEWNSNKNNIQNK